MNPVLSNLSLTFWTALAVSGILAKPILATLLRLNSRQTVSVHAPEGHQKKQGTPTMGGLIILAGALMAMLISGYRDWASITLLVGFTLIGFIDDFVVPRKFVGKRGLGWRQKILMQLVVAVGAAFIAGGGPVHMGVVVFIVLFFSNAYNFSDGLDGLAGTILLGLASGLFVLGFLANVSVTLLMPLVAMVGATVPFLFVNAPPARVFMGDVGSLPLGAVLGYVWAEMTPHAAGLPSVDWAPLVIIGLMMVAELVPVPLQILSVKLRKKKIFPYTPIHHAFEKAGWPETRVVYSFALVQLLLAALAVSWMVGLPSRATSPSHTVVHR